MEIKDLLPIGSVIWLRNAEHALMIHGVMQQNLETGEEYDYIGVLYPEGNMGEKTQFLFMHEDIEKIVFRGYEDDSRAEFIKRLSEFYKGQH
jgi:hypothetical protein